MSRSRLFAGVMTGNSMDAIDIAVLRLGEPVTLGHEDALIELACFSSKPLDISIREALQSLLSAGADELHRAALIANSFADLISRATLELLASNGLASSDIHAIGVHGQTIRHRPEFGYSLQLNAPARIAEITGIAVVSDFRSRDIAAGGQGAPLVPAFHEAIFKRPTQEPSSPIGVTAVVNIGGIANISWLGPRLVGYDTGPGNLLMDEWAQQHLGQAFDDNGQWAQSGRVDETLLAKMLADPFFSTPPPRSTGRELFCRPWLEKFLAQKESSKLTAQDVQATLLALTTRSIANEIQKLEKGAEACASLIVCGGGAKNGALMRSLARESQAALGRPLEVTSSQAHGWDPQAIEASAFAWLAARALQGLAGNAPGVTGAMGSRVLGSITPGAHRPTQPNA